MNKKTLTQLNELGYDAHDLPDHGCVEIAQGHAFHYLKNEDAITLAEAGFNHPVDLGEYSTYEGYTRIYHLGTYKVHTVPPKLPKIDDPVYYGGVENHYPIITNEFGAASFCFAHRPVAIGALLAAVLNTRNVIAVSSADKTCYTCQYERAAVHHDVD